MDIGTAKLTPAEREGVPHHVLDLWEVTEPASVAEYQRARPGRDRRRSWPAAGRRCWSAAPACTCGRCWSDFEFPGTDAGAARAAGGRAGRGSARPRCTPGCARATRPRPARILPSNGRRIVRALEVHRADRRARSRPRCPTPRPVLRRGPARRRPAIRPRWTSGSRARVDAMWAAGLVAEVRALAGRGPARGPHGQPGARLPAGAAPPRRRRATPRSRRAVDTVSATRRFVRRQRSWFRPRPAHPLARRRRPRPDRSRAPGGRAGRAG